MSLYVKSNVNDLEPYHTYLDLTVINNDRSVNTSPVPLQFSEMRTNPILMNPSEYFMSIVRFSLQTPSLPLFIPQIQTGQSDPNKTVYKVSMSYDVSGYGTVDASQNVIFVTENPFESTPPAPTTAQTINNSYYYVNNLNTFVNQVNTAFVNCYNTLNAAVTAVGGTLPSSEKPVLEYDPTNDTAILNADVSGYNDLTNDYIKVYFNTSLYNLFNSFEAINNGFSDPYGKNYRLRIYPYTYEFNIYEVASSGVNLCQMYQNFPTLKAMCNPVESIVFTTGMIPVNQTLISSPVVFGSDGNYGSVANNDNLTPQLTDFIVPVEGLESYKPVVYYNATKYRLKDMRGNSPLSGVNMAIFWKTRFGTLIPFLLSQGCSADVKIMFRRKEYNIPIHKFT